MNVFQKNVIALLSAPFPYAKTCVFSPEDSDWESLYQWGRQHQVLPLFYHGIRNLHLTPPPEIFQQLRNNAFHSIFAEETQLHTLERVFSAFDAAGIDYLPLKGTVIKPLYPEPGMRTMSDADVLIHTDQYSKIHSIMAELEFQEVKESDHEYVWQKPGCLLLELHKQLVSSRNTDFCNYYGDGWKRAIPCQPDSRRYMYSDEDTFVFLFVHYAKHYRAAGIGIRHILDLWVFLNAKSDMDMDRVTHELNQLGLKQFYLHTLETLKVWFDGSPSNTVTDVITDWIFSSGSYGKQENDSISSAIREADSSHSYKNARWKRLLHSIFPPYTFMSKKYSLLDKMPFFLPAFWLYRLFNILTHKKHNIKRELDTLNNLTQENINAYQRHLNLVGLKMK